MSAPVVLRALPHSAFYVVDESNEFYANANSQNVCDEIIRNHGAAASLAEAVALLRRCADAFPREHHDAERISTLRNLNTFLSRLDGAR